MDRETFLDIVSENLGNEITEYGRFNPRMTLSELGADSLDKINILMEAEEETGVEFTEAEADRIGDATLHDAHLMIVHIVDQRRAERRSRRK